MTPRLKLAWATLSAQYRCVGLRGSAAMAARRVRRRPGPPFELCASLVTDGRGLEIGGPSPIFSKGGLVPVYPLVGSLDNCNFARDTIWEGPIVEGSTFNYSAERDPGQQFILDGADLGAIPVARYDFVLSSHTIEHIADPLREWRRVLRDEGTLILVVPHKDRTFDHRRPATTLDHLREDFAHSVEDADPTHIDEFVDLIDLTRVPGLARAELVARMDAIRDNRAIHHHVFTTELVVQLLDEVEFQILAVEGSWPAHIIVVARVPHRDARVDNDRFLGVEAPSRNGIFPSDRLPPSNPGRAGAVTRPVI